MKPRWLDRDIGPRGPYLILCLSEDEFRSAIEHMKIHTEIDWCTKDGCAHIFNCPDGGLCAVVCLKGSRAREPVEIAGLIVHEAVHVWQHFMDDIGEKEPGREQEAYGIQSIAQNLMEEYARRISVDD